MPNFCLFHESVFIDQKYRKNAFRGSNKEYS